MPRAPDRTSPRHPQPPRRSQGLRRRRSRACARDCQRREFIHDHRLEGQFSEPRQAVHMDIIGPLGAD
eukprot:4205221-Pyramimonas_sp.AAC.1